MRYAQFGPLVVTAVVLALATSSCTNQAMSTKETAPAAEQPEIVVEGDFVRVGADAKSGSEHTVRGECGDNVAAWPNATASLEIRQIGTTSDVSIRVENAKPDTLYTIWLRLDGEVTNQDGEKIAFGGHPITGGGGTSLSRGDELSDVVIPNSPPNPGTREPSNGFWTDAMGNGALEKALDYPVIGGAYPFNLVGAVPTAIVNPADQGVSSGFLLRIVSHCQDDLAHGWSPGDREAWFDFP